jgi:hypothetical protein
VNSDEDALLDALVDGAPLSGGYAPAGLEKLARVQKAFASLQWAELDSPVEQSKILFHWDHLARLDA